MLLLETETVAEDLVEGSSEDKTYFVNGAHPRIKTVPEITIAANLQAYMGQQIAFKQLLAAGVLAKAANGTYVAAGGFTRGPSPLLF